MKVILQGNVKHDGKQYAPGDELPGLSGEQVDRLQHHGVVREVIEEKKTKNKQTNKENNKSDKE